MFNFCKGSDMNLVILYLIISIVEAYIHVSQQYILYPYSGVISLVLLSCS